jgi:hypothetical protein
MKNFQEALKQLKIELEREEGAIQQLSVDVLKANVNVMTNNPKDLQSVIETIQNQAFLNFFGQTGITKESSHDDEDTQFT